MVALEGGRQQQPQSIMSSARGGRGAGVGIPRQRVLPPAGGPGSRLDWIRESL